jgi:hypothetical protein
MEAILIVFVAAVLIVIPSLVFLYTLSQRSIVEAEPPPPSAGASSPNP